jgi:hypothetical protein
LIISHKSPSRSRRINEQRQRAIEAGLTWRGDTYQIDPASVQLITLRALKLATELGDESVQWRTMDNRTVTMNRMEFSKFAAAVDAHLGKLFQHSWLEKDGWS